MVAGAAGVRATLGSLLVGVVGRRARTTWGALAAGFRAAGRDRAAGFWVLAAVCLARATVRLAVVRLAGVGPARWALRALIREGRLEGRLEELTPELPDLADWVGHGSQGYDPRPRRCIDDSHWLGIRHALGMDADDAQVDAALLNH